jgi:hypothetical protein
MSQNFIYQVESFAELMAHLDDPFAERAAVLAESLLDEDRCKNLIDSWRVRFERDGAEDLAGRFAAAYQARRSAIHEKRRRSASGEAEGDARDVRFLNHDAQSFREEAAQVARQPFVDGGSPGKPGSAPIPPIDEKARLPVSPPSPAAVPPTNTPSPWAPAPAPEPPPPMIARPAQRLAGTADISAFVPRTSLPFSPSASASAESPPKRPSESPPRVGSGTADISAFVPRHLLPFAGQPAPPPQPAPAAAAQPDPSRRRLIRFDPQTGQPLPTPIWVDLPADPGSTGEGTKK